MSVNYAQKYSGAVDEKFSLGSLTQGVVNQFFDWIGVSTVKVFSVPTVAMNDYSLTGANRYGSPAELDNAAQEMTLRKDRSFTFTIDRKSNDDTMMTMEAGRALARQIQEVVIPEVDTYRIGQIFGNCKAGHGVYVNVTKDNAYAAFLDTQEILDDAKVPQAGRVCLCTPKYYKLIKQDEAFIKRGDLAQKILINGQIGEVDGVPIVKVPASYMPNARVHFIITNPIVSPGPIKLEEYKIHTDAPGISGWLVEGRVRYDCFALNNKKDAIGVSAAPITTVSATPGTTSRYSKDVSALQSNVVVGRDSISGNLKYVTGYTGFSGEASEQSGNYLALDFFAAGADSVVAEKVVNGAVVTSCDLSSDMYLVLRVTDTVNTQLRIKSTKDGETQVCTYDLSNLVLAES